MLAGREMTIYDLLSILEAAFAAAQRMGSVGAAGAISGLLIELDERFQVEQFADPAPLYTSRDRIVKRIERAISPVASDPGFNRDMQALDFTLLPPAPEPKRSLMWAVSLGALGLAGLTAHVLFPGPRRRRRS